MTRTRRQAKPPRGDVPRKRGDNRAEHRRHCDHVSVHQPFAYCRSNCAAEERAGQIEKCRHRNRSARRENSRRNHGRDRVGGVVKTVAVFKNDRGDDDRKKGQHSRSRLRILQRHFKDDVSRIPAAVDYLFH